MATDPPTLRVIEFYSGMGGMHMALSSLALRIPVEVVAAFDINTTANEGRHLVFFLFFFFSSFPPSVTHSFVLVCAHQVYTKRTSQFLTPFLSYSLHRKLPKYKSLPA